MEENKLKELLDKYYNGATSPEEELELKRYFSDDNVFTGYEAEKEIFRYYSGMEKINVPSADFEMRIIQSLDDLDKIKLKNDNRKKYIILFSAAATILLMIGSWFFLLREREPADTFSDPSLAYAETMRILNNVSVKLNRGTEALKPVLYLTGTARQGMRSVDRSLSAFSDGLRKAGLTVSLDETENKQNKKAIIK
jgi:gamma-glutamylcysteine synthetase